MTECAQDHQSKMFTILSIIVFVICAALLVAVVDIPPVLDYPNHYARIWLLSGGIGEAPLSSIYELDWSRTSTNIGIDLIAWKLGPVLGAVAIAKSALFLAIVMPPLGAALLNRYLLGAWHPWQVAIFFFAWCATMIGGFMNFQIGIGLALLFAIADACLHKRTWVLQFGWRVCATTILYYDHAFAAAFFLLVVVALEFSARFTPFQDRHAFWNFCRRAMMATMAWGAALIAIACLQEGKGTVPGEDFHAMWNDRMVSQVWNLLSAIWSYTLIVDVLFLIGLLVVQSILRKNGYRLHAGLLIATALLVVLSIASPRSAFGTGWISWRFPIMAALAATAMFLPSHLQRRSPSIVLCLIIVMTVFGRFAWISYNWVAYQPTVAHVRDLLVQIPPGSAVLQVGHVFKERSSQAPAFERMSWYDDTYRHLATLAVPIARSFVPTVFTAKGKQPLMVTPHWRSIDVPEDNLISTSTLICIPPEKFEGGYRNYLADWRNRFDYVLLLNADQPDKIAGMDLIGGLDLVDGSGFAQLYRVDRGWRADIGDLRPAYCDAAEPWQ
ncbi:hypothetical protein ACQQ2Q_03850 [Agrobacterium sp. ES01]|uniref:hypothetical protein n=1 Tax=Agrobacterium sp. ES01 TaxID=3420714 RepID=UPI003D14EE25